MENSLQNYDHKVSIEFPDDREFTESSFKEQINYIMDTFIGTMKPDAIEDLVHVKNSLRILSVMRDHSRQSIKVIAFFIVSFFTTSCGSTNDGPTAEELTNDRIEGFWEIESVTESGTELIGTHLSRAALNIQKTGPDSGRINFIFYETGDNEESRDIYSYKVTSPTTLSSSDLGLITVSFTPGLSLRFTADGALYYIQAK